MRALWKTLNSTRFVIILLILLAVASIGGIILGERFPTGFYGAEQHYRAQFGDRTFEFLVRLGVFQPFRSFWFHSLLVLLSASLIACSVSRLRVTVKTARGLSFRRSPEELMSLRHHARLAIAGLTPAGRTLLNEAATIVDEILKDLVTAVSLQHDEMQSVVQVLAKLTR